jgi:protein disulfide-isomerase-like protein
MMKFIAVVILSTLIIRSQAVVELTADDFEARTAGTKAMIKFYAPWCGHCKKLAPVWDQLAEKADVLVAKVDCTVHKELCQKQQVQGYPTLKYTNGYGYNSYQGGRDLDSFLTFIEENLNDGCLDDDALCTPEEKELLTELKGLENGEVNARMEAIETDKGETERLFREHVQKLQDQYQTLSKEKDEKLKELGKDEAYLRYVINMPEPEEGEMKEEL